MSNVLHFYNKETRRTLGYVAEFCPIERKITAQRVEAVSLARYVTFVRVGEGAVLRHDRVCEACGIEIPAVETGYERLADDGQMPLADLEELTNPGVTEREQDLIALREEIERRGAVDPALKSELLKEQFSWLERIAARYWTGETRLDRLGVWFGVGSAIFLFLGMVAIGEWVPPARRLDAMGVGMVVWLVVLTANAVVFFLGPRRAIRRQVLPLIATALRPLAPTPLEVDSLLEEMRREGYRYATKVNRRQLMRLIHRAERPRR